MLAGNLEAEMRALGVTYLLGVFVQFRIGDRNVLLPLCAAWIAYLLSHLQSYRALSDSSWFTLAWVSAAAVAVSGFLAWVPAVEPGNMAVVFAIGFPLGSAGYAGALQQWCIRQGWDAPAAVARSAVQWMIATTAVVGLAIVLLLVTVTPGRPDPDISMFPSTVLRRPLAGTGVGVGLAVLLVMAIVAMLRLRKASQIIRHGLRAQSQAALVAV